MAEFAPFFRQLAGLPDAQSAHRWQAELAAERRCENRLIRVPTGFGKTLGVLAAWLWNRAVHPHPGWPRRLVWCLPMRVLVEQVADEIRAALLRAGEPAAHMPVFTLLGGADAGEWHLYPERDCVLVGTQDMLLSRALNRGYGAPRARWPMEFGLLNVDALWVMDEVQLMDVGLATSAQLQVYRDQAPGTAAAAQSCRTWWMSATLQPDWLQCSPEMRDGLSALPISRVEPHHRIGPMWDQNMLSKPVSIVPSASAKQMAAMVVAAHARAGNGAEGPTLVVVNRVDRAIEVFDALMASRKGLTGVDIRLVHSRFRPAERVGWRQEFLHRGSCQPGCNRIVVATQVIEAGVDISAAVLVTDLAPWPSLVQRWGRSARWGGHARVIVVDVAAGDEKAAAPYDRGALDAARAALIRLDDVSPASLEAFEEALPDDERKALYPYEPTQLLLRHEVDELFDTTPDLSGADVDISRFIRSGDERDLQVFWRPVPVRTLPERQIRALRDEMCAVPFLKAREWLFGKGAGQRLLPGKRAWIWDWVEGCWSLAERRRLYPGQTLLVSCDSGGYDPVRGWQAHAKDEVRPLAHASGAGNDPADADHREDDESLSTAAHWQTIAFHGLAVAREASALARQLVPSLAPLLHLAGRWHDVGKRHEAFQGCLLPHSHGDQIAKAPASQWLRGQQLYRLQDGSQRRGFRHELASTLALLALLRRCAPDHAGMLGPWRSLLQQLPCAADLPPPVDQASAEHSVLEREVVAQDAASLDLLLYLVCSHHGKVRVAWHASPADQAANDSALRIRGVRTGDLLPALHLADAAGTIQELPAAELVLAPAGVGLNPHSGRGWTERVLGLLQRHGPFRLAFLEAVMRAADQRASRDDTLADPALLENNDAHGLARVDQALASTARGGETAPPLAEHSLEGGAQLRLRGRAGGPGRTGSGTRPPAHATRYLETCRGTLSYLELAPLLASAARSINAEIESGVFDGAALDEYLVVELHRRLCGALTPQLTGWRRHDVVVGAHTPPAHHLVPQMMREYALDLSARLQDQRSDQHLLEALAFAEGRLLSVHPFADFNGRVTRLWLTVLLRRLDLPETDPTPQEADAEAYFAALRAADQRNWQPLCAIWRARFEQTP